MQSKISFFNWTIFKKNLTRHWPLWVAYVVVWMLALPANLASFLSYAISEQMQWTINQMILREGIIAGIFVTLVFGILSAMATWNYMYNARSVSMYASLPLSRSGMFSAQVVSVVCITLVCNLFIALSMAAVELAYGVFNIIPILQWFAVISMMSIFFFGFATFCGMLTGVTLALPALYTVLNFTAYVVMEIINSILSWFIYGYAGVVPKVVQYFSPPIAMGMGTTGGIEFLHNSPGKYVITSTFWNLFIAYCIVGVILLAVSMFMYKKRRMESAGDIISVLTLKPIFKYCMSFGCALVLGSGMYSIIESGSYYWISKGMPDLICLCLCMVVGAFIGYFASEMLLKKTLKVFKKGWLGFGIVSVIVVSLMLCAELDIAGYETKIPALEQVESVHMNGGFLKIDSQNENRIEEIISLHSAILEGKDQEIFDYQADVCYIRLDYILKDGGQMSRFYYLPFYPYGPEEMLPGSIKKMQELLESKGFIDEAMKDILNAEERQFEYSDINIRGVDGTYSYITLTPAEIKELFDSCIYPDILEGTIHINGLNIGQNYGEAYACDIGISFRIPDAYEAWDAYQYYSFSPTPDSKRTNEWLLEHDVELVQNKDTSNYRVDYGKYVY